MTTWGLDLITFIGFQQCQVHCQVVGPFRKAYKAQLLNLSRVRLVPEYKCSALVTLHVKHINILRSSVTYPKLILSPSNSHRDKIIQNRGPMELIKQI